MSEENVGIVRANFETWNEGRMDDFRDLFDPDVAVMRFIEEWPGTGPVLGRDAVMAFYEDVRPWDDTTVEPISEFVDSGDQVAVRVLWRASTQGQEVGMELTIVYAVRNGKIARIEFFRDHAEALGAAGLSEWTMSQETLEAFARQIIEAFNHGLDDYMAMHAPDVVVVTAPEWPEGGTYRGLEAARGVWAAIFAEQEMRAGELYDVVVLEDARLLYTVRIHAKGLASGVATTTVFYTVATERGGLISRMELYLNHGQALEAVGLSE